MDVSSPSAATQNRALRGWNAKLQEAIDARTAELGAARGLDEACFCCEALHLGLPKNLCSEAFQFVFDGGYESFGRKMAIFGEEDAACDIHGDGWIEGSGGFGIEHV